VFGDLYIKVVTEVPMSLTKRQKELLAEFKTLEDTKSNPLIRKFFEKTKTFGSLEMKKINLAIPDA
jgi:molecular chaperone DnaJ